MSPENLLNFLMNLLSVKSDLLHFFIDSYSLSIMMPIYPDLYDSKNQAFIGQLPT